MGSIKDVLSPAMGMSLDLFGETITIQSYSHDGRHPEENTHQWIEESPFDVQGVILENQRPREVESSSTQQITGEYHIFVDSDVNVNDGRQSDTERASVITDSDGNTYDVLRVTDEHNGLYRCQCSMEDP